MAFLWFIVGSIFGSAGNAIIDRMPNNISWFKGRSKCDHCQHELSWIDLIPLLSYLFLDGKCRYCKKRISIRNFLFELAMGIGFMVLGTWQLALIFWVTMIIAVMDWETKLVSDLLVFVWGAAVILSNLSVFSDSNYLIGLGVGVGLIGGLWAATRGRGMGFGDVEIAAVAGLWLGWPKIGIGLWIAFVVGAIYGIMQIIKRKAGMRSEIAFGPFLIFGAWVAYLWGDKIKLL